MATLYILCGISGCGKTTWAQVYMNQHPEVKCTSRDTIRYSLLKDGEDYFSHEKEVFRIFTNTIAQDLINGDDTIADATHLNQFSRKKLTSAIDRYIKDYQIKYVVFNVPLKTCQERNEQRSGRAKVKKEIIRDMRRDFMAPTLGEDSRAVEIITVGKDDGDFSYLMEPYRKEQ